MRSTGAGIAGGYVDFVRRGRKMLQTPARGTSRGRQRGGRASQEDPALAGASPFREPQRFHSGLPAKHVNPEDTMDRDYNLSVALMTRLTRPANSRRWLISRNSLIRRFCAECMS